jgi:hypothetical protein
MDSQLVAAVTDSQQRFTGDAASARNRFGLLSIGMAVLAVAIVLFALFGTKSPQMSQPGDRGRRE